MGVICSSPISFPPFALVSSPHLLFLGVEQRIESPVATLEVGVEGPNTSLCLPNFGFLGGLFPRVAVLLLAPLLLLLLDRLRFGDGIVLPLLPPLSPPCPLNSFTL